MPKRKANCISKPAEPAGSVCGAQTNCLLEFDGYWWWTNYPYNISGEGYWFNERQWDPRLAYVDHEGLHLEIRQTQMPGGALQWSAIEVLLWGERSFENTPGNPPPRFYPGYGTYLVAASTPGGFDALANVAIFGAFTYRFDADSSQVNSNHELDMIEVSRWSNVGQTANAQFTLQPYSVNGNIHPFKLDNAEEITIVMYWPAAACPVKFWVYYGIHDLEALPAVPDFHWTTTMEQNTYIPDDSCQTIHFNLRREASATAAADTGHEVIIRKFRFRGMEK